MNEYPVGAEQLKGMSNRWRTQPDEPELLENVYLDKEGCWRTCGGVVQVDAAPDQVRNIHWFAQHNGSRQWTVIEYQTSANVGAIAYQNYPTTDWVNIETGRTLPENITTGTSFAEQGDWLYMLNGYDAPIRWNGREKVRVGFGKKPSRPLVNVAGTDHADGSWDIYVDAAGLLVILDFASSYQRGVGSAFDPGDDDAGRFLYGYAVQYVNDRGMASPLSGVTWVQGENDSLVLGLHSINVFLREAPEHVRGVRIYRTINMYLSGATAGATMYLIAEYPTGGAIAFADDTPDHELLTEVDQSELGVWPARAKRMHLFKGVAFVDDGPDVRYSAPGFIEQMPAQNRLILGDATSGPVMGFKSTRNALVVFKRRGIYLIKGDPLNGFFAETLTEEIGCAAPRAIVEVPNAGTMFLHDDGPYLLVGALENTGTPTEVVYIGAAISRTWQGEVNTRALLSATASRYTRDREVWVQVPANGDDRPKLGLIFHYEVQGWSKRTDFPFECMAEARDHRGYLYAGSWNTHPSVAGLLVYTRGSNESDANTVAQQTVWTTVESEIHSPWHTPARRVRSTAHAVDIYALNTGRDFDVDWRIDRQAETWPTENRSDSTWEKKDYEQVRSTWGSGDYDTNTWEATVPIDLRVPFRTYGSHEFQWRIVGEKLAVFGYHTTFTSTSDIKRAGVDV